MSSDKVCTKMIMRWCNAQTNEYDLQAKTYPTVCTHHKLHNTNKYKFPVSRNVYTISDRIWCNKHLRHTTTEKYENNGKGGYFRFDDDNSISCRYILSITLLKWASCETHVPWCMSGSQTRDGGENAPGIPCACASRDFSHLVRGP